MFIGARQVPSITSNNMNTSPKGKTQNRRTLTNNNQNHVRFPASPATIVGSVKSQLQSFAPIQNLLHHDTDFSNYQGK